jgi:hypothetical protein
VAEKVSASSGATRSDSVARPSRTALPLILVAAWAIPGAGHLWLGRRQKGLVFLVALPLMFAAGLWLEGQLFHFNPVDLNFMQAESQPLVALMALADMGMGIPYLFSRAGGLGAGRVVAWTYEYGNTFLLVAGLLNLLVVLDAFDVAEGRK